MPFDVRSGEVITLLDRSGMGRSITVKCLFGMVASSAGTIDVEGVRADRLPSRKLARRGLALAPEERRILTAPTAEENLIATAHAPKGLDACACWTLERADDFFPRLRERRGKLGSQLPGGATTTRSGRLIE